MDGLIKIDAAVSLLWLFSLINQSTSLAISLILASVGVADGALSSDLGCSGGSSYDGEHKFSSQVT